MSTGFGWGTYLDAELAYHRERVARDFRAAGGRRRSAGAVLAESEALATAEAAAAERTRRRARLPRQLRRVAIAAGTVSSARPSAAGRAARAGRHAA